MTVADWALCVLSSGNPEHKVQAAFDLQSKWTTHQVLPQQVSKAPDTPARPDKPVLVPPADVPRRRLGSEQGRAALLHAVAHIEFNAIDLAADMIVRFGNDQIFATNSDRCEFISNWITVCADEARHFSMIQSYLNDLGYSYGTFPAHNGLWEAAGATSHDIAARLAIAPMVLEARGLDVTPPMIKKFEKVGDTRSVSILSTIYNEEVDHVKFGTLWFNYVSKRRGYDPKAYFQEQVRSFFKGILKRPFNEIARLKAGLEREYYLPLSE